MWTLESSAPMACKQSRACTAQPYPGIHSLRPPYCCLQFLGIYLIVYSSSVLQFEGLWLIGAGHPTVFDNAYDPLKWPLTPLLLNCFTCFSLTQPHCPFLFRFCPVSSVPLGQPWPHCCAPLPFALITEWHVTLHPHLLSALPFFD